MGRIADELSKKVAEIETENMMLKEKVHAIKSTAQSMIDNNDDPAAILNAVIKQLNDFPLF